MRPFNPFYFSFVFFVSFQNAATACVRTVYCDASGCHEECVSALVRPTVVFDGVTADQVPFYVKKMPENTNLNINNTGDQLRLTFTAKNRLAAKSLRSNFGLSEFNK